MENMRVTCPPKLAKPEGVDKRRRMQLTEFLTFLKELQAQPGIVCFSHKTYPALFFSHLQRVVRSSYTLQAIDTTTLSISEIQTQCSMSFLGQHNRIWLGNVSELDAKRQRQLLDFCSSYTGPHTLWFFYTGSLEKLSSPSCIQVQLPQDITLQDYQALCTAWYPQIARTASGFQDLFVQAPVDLEFATMLLQYHVVLGRQVDRFNDEWASKLREPTHSLFTLATHFFAKQSTPFFRLWKTIEPEYPAVFWSTYWSEQLFRAACVKEAMRSNNYVQAKKMAYRLPFSFMQKDYKRVKVAELQRAHQFMYDYDVHVKNNGTPEFLDIMFGVFFTGSSVKY